MHTQQVQLGHDKMILCLAVAHASTFNTPCQTFFWLNQRVKFFKVIRSFYLQTFLATYFILLHLSIQIFTLEIHS